jgi:hypothetical protein
MPSMPAMPAEPVSPPPDRDQIIRDLEAQLATYKSPNAELMSKVLGCVAFIAIGLLFFWLSCELIYWGIYRSLYRLLFTS